MSTSLSATFSLIGQQVSIYFGIPIFILGIVGSILALIVLLSLQTFRQNSCAFYLIIMQVFNIGMLLAGLLSRIMITGFNIDLTIKFSVFCKLRAFFVHPPTMMPLTCLCLATIDQYFATCSRPTWQRWSNLKIAHRLVIGFSIGWVLHATLFLIFADIINIPSLGISYCASPNTMFLEYFNYMIVLILTGILPIMILSTFGSLAYYNVRHANYRTVPLVRQELDKQLTTMVLLQVLLNLISLVPYVIVSTLSLVPRITTNPVSALYLKLFH